ncbi:hypothetical protein CLOSTMETH_00563 [[Clostridium] methylpentosum DSM 5476]|uniref:Uncharacterized protein n=1 Tax=[Clostridium] methylpentosum DSM 5476 TaxID=537013 RepID=C0E9R2_9FIRM|nr:hypothetical protein CLOSTMETH_00563 [[Clostridium] methylpentosum DSM 5476]
MLLILSPICFSDNPILAFCNDFVQQRQESQIPLLWFLSCYSGEAVPTHCESEAVVF